MTLTFTRTNADLHVHLRGKLDGDGTDTLRRKISTQDLGAVELLVFDFSRLDYISSHGIGFLAEIHRRLEPHGGRIRIENASPDIKKLFSLMQLQKIFALA